MANRVAWLPRFIPPQTTPTAHRWQARAPTIPGVLVPPHKKVCGKHEKKLWGITPRITGKTLNPYKKLGGRNEIV